MAASYRFKQIARANKLNLNKGERIEERPFIEFTAASVAVAAIANILEDGESVEFGNTVKLSK
jgi:hypothetical protein